MYTFFDNFFEKFFLTLYILICYTYVIEVGRNMNEEKLDYKMDEEELNALTKPLKITKKNKQGMKIESSRFTSPTKRYGASTSICTRDGQLTKIYTNFNNYNRTTKIVKVYPGCYYIKAKYNKNGHSVSVFRVDDIDLKMKSISLSRVATYKEGKWDDIEVFHTLKKSITSTINKAKKYYYFLNID